jgi:signal transduction histidine kinase
VLALRSLTLEPSAGGVRKLVHGGQRAQQETAGQFVALAFQLGQLAGKIALAPSNDELNSIVANEVAQNLDRSRAHMSALLTLLDKESAIFARASAMQRAFEQVAKEVADPEHAESLLSLRRKVLAEAEMSVAIRKQVAESVETFSAGITRAQAAVAEETRRSARAASWTLWAARLGTLFLFAVAVRVGFRLLGRMRESIRALRTQNEQLESLSAELKGMNEGLEGLVAERSLELVKRQRSMRLVLDSVEEGLVLCDLLGNIVGESSKAAVEWFGTPSEGTKIWQYLVAGDSRRQSQFQLGYEQVAEDMLPFEASVDCLPHRLERRGLVFELHFTQVFEEGQFYRVLVSIKDVTARVLADAREREAREQQMLLAALLRDRSGFRAFVQEGESMLADLRMYSEREPTLRTLHTLKGNTAIYGMERVAKRCHELEERLLEVSGRLVAQDLDELTELWRAPIRRVEEMVTADSFVELAEVDYAEVVQALRQRMGHEDLASLVESWKWASTASQLQRLGRQVRSTAERLDKEVEITLEPNRLRIVPGPLDPLWGSLVHVVRNAIDHGIETPDERRAHGKSPKGRMTLRSDLKDDELIIEIRDDGRGIDFEAVKQAAIAQGLPAGTKAEITQALFQDGLTTRTEATEISGRGVGLAAVREICDKLHGRIEVDSTSGMGTTFRLLFPTSVVQVRQATRVALQRSLLPSAAPANSGQSITKAS